MNIACKFFGHLKTVCTHKYWVFYYCRKAGITWQGIKHDISKFSPTEFFESVKYFQGNRSPIDACKEENGWSAAWMHHKGRNPHHYEYYVDNLDNGGVAIQMPEKFAIELICDYLGAGRAYMKKDFSYQAEYEWWLKKSEKPLLMHSHTKNFISLVLFKLTQTDNDKDILNKKVLIDLYRSVEG
jgi:hypothetical protein